MTGRLSDSGANDTQRMGRTQQKDEMGVYFGSGEGEAGGVNRRRARRVIICRGRTMTLNPGIKSAAALPVGQ